MISATYADLAFMYQGTSSTWSTAVTTGPMASMMPQSPRKHIMRCRHCGTSSMIPDSTDKIVALVCPQCGGVLDE